MNLEFYPLFHTTHFYNLSAKTHVKKDSFFPNPTLLQQCTLPPPTHPPRWWICMPTTIAASFWSSSSPLLALWRLSSSRRKQIGSLLWLKIGLSRLHVWAHQQLSRFNISQLWLSRTTPPPPNIFYELRWGVAPILDGTLAHSWVPNNR